MTTNTYNNMSHITAGAMNVLRNGLTLVPRVNRSYEKEFLNAGAMIGNTINVRNPGLAGAITVGKTVSPDPHYDEFVPIVVAQRNIGMRFSSKELALNVEEGGEFEKTILAPRMLRLVNQIEIDGYALYKNISAATGTPGTKPTTLEPFSEARAILIENCVPTDDEIYCHINPRSSNSLVNGLKSLFQDSSEIAKQYKKGVMGVAAGMSFVESINTPSHTVGTIAGSTPEIDGATLEGATSLVIDGWNAGVSNLAEGDILTVGAVYAVNPITKQSTGELMQFRVKTAVVDVVGSMTVEIDPPVYTATSGGRQNVSALPLNNALVLVYGHASNYSAKTGAVNLVLHKDCMGFAMRDLPISFPATQKRVRDEQLGLSIRMEQWRDGINDDVVYRMDVMYGWAVLRDKFGVRVHA